MGKFFLLALPVGNGARLPIFELVSYVLGGLLGESTAEVFLPPPPGSASAALLILYLYLFCCCDMFFLFLSGSAFCMGGGGSRKTVVAGASSTCFHAFFEDRATPPRASLPYSLLSLEQSLTICIWTS